MTDAILASVFAFCCVAALAGWAWTLTSVSRSLLPNAQAYQALDKVNAIMDERIRSILANIKPSRANAVDPTKTVNNELEEIARRAQAMGFEIKRDGTVDVPAPMMPPPDSLFPVEEG